MSIVFFGTPRFAVPSLDALLQSGEDVSLVVTQRDKRRGRSAAATPSPVKEFALSKGLGVIEPASMKDEGFLETLTSLSPEFLVVVAYGRILTPAVLAAPSVAPVNLHASLLPRYRGAAPIAWAVINGDAETGLCTMLITEKLDEGDTLICEAHPILPEDTAGRLAERLAPAGGPLLIRTLKGLRDGALKPRPQVGEFSFAPPLKKDDGLVDWSKTAVELHNFVRGMHPWPGAFCFLGGKRVILIKASPAEGVGRPGVVEKVSKDSFTIGTGSGLLRVFELQPEGKRPMSAGDFVRGYRVGKGTVLG